MPRPCSTKASSLRLEPCRRIPLRSTAGRRQVRPARAHGAPRGVQARWAACRGSDSLLCAWPMGLRCSSSATTSWSKNTATESSTQFGPAPDDHLARRGAYPRQRASPTPAPTLPPAFCQMAACILSTTERGFWQCGIRSRSPWPRQPTAPAPRGSRTRLSSLGWPKMSSGVRATQPPSLSAVSSPIRPWCSPIATGFQVCGRLTLFRSRTLAFPGFRCALWVRGQKQTMATGAAPRDLPSVWTLWKCAADS